MACNGSLCAAFCACYCQFKWAVEVSTICMSKEAEHRLKVNNNINNNNTATATTKQQKKNTFPFLLIGDGSEAEFNFLKDSSAFVASSASKYRQYIYGDNTNGNNNDIGT